jgi:ribosomal protein S18 acetylase RimI-like enzyme
MSITYQSDLQGITADRLQGFFVGWPNPPAPATHLRLLAGSAYVELAVDSVSGQVVGFISAISDGVLTAYIPLLEVLPACQGQGIGAILVTRLLARLSHLYAVDLLCDADVQPFYGRLGMRPATGMMMRHYDRQSGA